jgi:hypothetical protein
MTAPKPAKDPVKGAIEGSRRRADFEVSPGEGLFEK